MSPIERVSTRFRVRRIRPGRSAVPKPPRSPPNSGDMSTGMSRRCAAERSLGSVPDGRIQLGLAAWPSRAGGEFVEEGAVGDGDLGQRLRI